MTEAQPAPAVRSASEKWWKAAVVYQVWPRSFADSNGDGIGDIPGITAHLDHIRDLGIDVLWLSPIFRSPQDDAGYDISDYQEIDPLFGTLDDMDELLAGAHERGMKVVLDLVVNHTSDEHEWFEQSRQDRTNPYADWYMWRDPRPGTVGGEPGAEPNNWGSFFGGSAWEWEPKRGQYYLHLFSRKQPDLNWENPRMRAAVHRMMTWWLDRGADGFRMDVINFISKDPGLPDGELLENGYGDGSSFFSYGPHVHDYLAEMKRAVFDPRDEEPFTVGEMPNVTPEQAARFTDEETGQLNMVFQFEHVDLDHDGSKWVHRDAGVPELRDSLGKWQRALADSGWNSLYWNNHDQPRVVSRWGDDTEHWRDSATALATILHLQRGTPYVYQGEEIGMTNGAFAELADFHDIEALGYHREAIRRGVEASSALEAMRIASRDNARTPMQWDGRPGAGFTTGTPWMAVNPHHTWLNVAAQEGDEQSILAFYRRLIALRHELPVVVDGDFETLLPDHPSVFAFTRTLGDTTLTVVANLSGAPVALSDSETAGVLVGDPVLVNSGLGTGPELAPWEARVLLRKTIAAQ